MMYGFNLNEKKKCKIKEGRKLAMQNVDKVLNLNLKGKSIFTR